MRAKDKKYRILEKELRRIGYTDPEVIDKAIEELNTIAMICIDAYRSLKKKNESNNIL